MLPNARTTFLRMFKVIIYLFVSLSNALFSIPQYRKRTTSNILGQKYK